MKLREMDEQVTYVKQLQVTTAPSYSSTSSTSRPQTPSDSSKSGPRTPPS